LATDFSKQLLKWHKTISRDMPWKSIKDPYKIWLSEIILQQTQVSQGIPYYNTFVKRFPDVKSLAESDLDEVMALWKGLGYYSRARNLHKAAIHVMEVHKGVFPSSYEDVKAMPGVGEYTASAICSFAYGLPHAVLDANVIRILARYYCIEEEVHKSAVQKELKAKAKQLLDVKSPGRYNQAIMDFGALVCKPKEPQCGNCVMVNSCLANARGKVAELPSKKTKKPRRERYFHYFEIEQSKKLLVRQRGEKDIWHSLYELPFLETSSGRKLTNKKIERYLEEEIGGIRIIEIEKLDLTYKQTLSHQFIHGVFYKVMLKDDLPQLKAPYLHVSWKRLKKMAIPKLIDWYIGQKPITLH